MLRSIAATVFVFATFGTQSGFAQGGNQTVLPVVEWEEKIGVQDRLRSYGEDILGDGIDPHTGGISFTQTDVSIPGNSHLEVAVRRKISQGYFYSELEDAEFGDWHIDVPRIHVVAGTQNSWPPTGKNRCTDNYTENFPTLPMTVKNGLSVSGNNVDSTKYSNGVVLDAPGASGSQILEYPSGAQWPAGTTHVTTNNWYFTCGTATDGNGGFIGHAPNGDVYTFNTAIVRRHRPMRTTGGKSGPQGGRQRVLLAASEVTDVHGNWVKYDYDTDGRLTKIHANDGREITLSYSGASRLISSVSTNGRTWNYAYRQTDYVHGLMVGGDGNREPNQVLDSVTLPNNTSWQFTLDNIVTPPGPGTCFQPNVNLSLTHPSGASGSFTLAEREHRGSYNALQEIQEVCPDIEGPAGGTWPIPTFEVQRFKTMSVISKSLSGPNLTTVGWSYAYEQDQGAAGTSGSDRTNTTWVTAPGGVHLTYKHYWNDIGQTYAPGAVQPIGGSLHIKEVRQGGGALLETQTTDYIAEAGAGNTFAAAGPGSITRRTPTRTYESKIERDTDWYKTRYTYGWDSSLSSYSFGSPTKTEQWSNTSGGSANKRITDTEYQHKTGNWILGLPDKVTRNGVVFEEHNYNWLGQRTWTDRFGVRVSDYTYYTTQGTYDQKGKLRHYDDALSRRTTFSQYKRGLAQSVTRADASTLSATVDNNGWVTSSTNGEGDTTSYQYNTMGWPTQINPPGPESELASTNITYLNVGGGSFRQEAVQDTMKTTVWYDGLFRPYRTKIEPLSGGGKTTYTRTEYDIYGRETFVSFPETTWWPAGGTSTTYDALGRPTQIAENVGNNITTTIAYVAGGTTTPGGTAIAAPRVVTTDPLGKVTRVYTQGYGAPEDGGVVYIDQEKDINTEMTYDDFGNMLEVWQYGTSNGYTVSHKQEYEYDGKMRLCRHYVPETGETRMEYNVAGEVIEIGKGFQQGSGCPGAWGDRRVFNSYDDLGRLTTVNFVDTATPDITHVYDDNSNVTKTTRGDTVWDYKYTINNQLEEEKLTITDGGAPFIYTTMYAYNALGALSSQTTPGNLIIQYTPNGLGQPTQARKGSQAYADNIDYHVNGEVISLDYGNGFTLNNTFDVRKMLRRIEVKNGAAVAVDLDYTRDDNGRIISVNDRSALNHDKTYAYDGVGRLVSSTGPWGNATFTYDPLGNIRQKTLGSRTVDIDYVGTGGAGDPWNVNRVDCVNDSAAAGGCLSYAYDDRGNVVDNGPLTFTYDRADQPVAMGGASTGSFVYDGNLKRVKQVIDGETIYSVYSKSGAILYRENVNKGQTYDYIRIAGKTITYVKEGNNVTVRYRHQDHLGSLVAQTKPDGTIQWQEDYTPFGEKWLNNAAADDEGFTGHIDDTTTGLTYMQARYYDPVTGRFLSNDPVQFSPGAPQMFNRYSYTANDPVNYIDPDGQCYGLALQGASHPCAQFAGGVYDRGRAYAAATRYGYGILRGLPGADFVSKSILWGLTAADNKRARQHFGIGSTRYSRARQFGNFVAAAAVGKGIKGGLGAMTGNASLGLGGSILDSAYQAFDALDNGGVDTSNLGDRSVAEIGLSAIAGATDYKYNADTKTLSAKLRPESGRATRIRRRVEIEIVEEIDEEE